MNYRDTFKISFYKEPAYYVDNEKKAVKCYLTCTIQTPNALNGNKLMDNTRISAVGYSKCDDKDTFDVHVGKKIALARAEEKVYFKALTMIKAASSDAKKFIDAVEKFEKKCYTVCAHNEDYVGQYCYATHPNYKGYVADSNTKEPNDLNKKVNFDKMCADKANCNKNAQPRDEHGRFKSSSTPNPSVIKIKINRV